MKLLSVCHSSLISNEKLTIITFLGDSRHFWGFWNNSTTTQTLKVFHFNKESCVGYWKIPQRSKSERTIKLRKRESYVRLLDRFKKTHLMSLVYAKHINRAIRFNACNTLLTTYIIELAKRQGGHKNASY